MDLISQCDSGPHTERCGGREDCWGECWDFVGMDDSGEQVYNATE